MVNNNNYPVDIPKTETIYELKDKIPSYEEFMKTYQADEWVNASYLSEINAQERGYGPCQNTLCGCVCPSNQCFCEKKFDSSIYESDSFRIGNCLIITRDRVDNAGFLTNFSLFRESRDWIDTKYLSASVGIILGENGLGILSNINITEYKSNGITLKIGINFDTGVFPSNDGFEFKAWGVGFSTGRKWGISLFFFELSIEDENNSGDDYIQYLSF